MVDGGGWWWLRHSVTVSESDQCKDGMRVVVVVVVQSSGRRLCQVNLQKLVLIDLIGAPTSKKSKYGTTDLLDIKSATVDIEYSWHITIAYYSLTKSMAKHSAKIRLRSKPDDIRGPKNGIRFLCRRESLTHK